MSITIDRNLLIERKACDDGVKRFDEFRVKHELPVAFAWTDDLLQKALLFFDEDDLLWAAERGYFPEVQQILRPLDPDICAEGFHIVRDYCRHDPDARYPRVEVGDMSLSWSDLDGINELPDDPEERKWCVYIPPHCTYNASIGDTGPLEQSNYEACQEIARCGTVTGSLGSRGAFWWVVLPQEIADEVEDIAAALGRYPVLDEDRMSELEQEMAADCWESWGAVEFMDAIALLVVDEYDPDEEGLLDKDWTEHMPDDYDWMDLFGKCGGWDTSHPEGNSYYFDIDKAADGFSTVKHIDTVMEDAVIKRMDELRSEGRKHTRKLLLRHWPFGAIFEPEGDEVEWEIKLTNEESVIYNESTGAAWRMVRLDRTPITGFDLERG